MSPLRSTRMGRLSMLVVSSILGLAMVATAAGFASTAQATSSSAATTSAARPIAHTAAGSLTSRIVGTASHGRTVTGGFTPLHFSKKNGHLRVRGLISGVVHNANGSTRTFSVLRTMKVKSINGTPAHARTSARANCGILHLVLAPLDLNLLGLKVHLDRVVLDITAVSGPGNLLGNLLCSVAGLLDGGLGGLLGQLSGLLNRILGQLGLGL